MPPETTQQPEPELGYCKYCWRNRFLAVVEEVHYGYPHGKCTQCAREEAEDAAH